MKLWRFAKLPDRSLEAADQGLEALRKTDPSRLPIRVRQDEVEEQMLEALTPEADPQLVHAREVALGILPGAVLLGEEDLAIRTL